MRFFFGVGMGPIQKTISADICKEVQAKGMCKKRCRAEMSKSRFLTDQYEAGSKAISAGIGREGQAKGMCKKNGRTENSKSNMFRGRNGADSQAISANIGREE